MERTFFFSPLHAKTTYKTTVSVRYAPSAGGIVRSVRLVLMLLGVLVVTFMGTTILESILFSDWLNSLEV
ncbi:MAG TPA: hypothetical protein VJO34_16845 [Methylomirabilota bacterium]|nr:hypothetical protein [Methylomirabilota bacterium]